MAPGHCWHGQDGAERGEVASPCPCPSPGELLHHGKLRPFCCARLRNEAAAVIYAIN